jgi:hypothetical protein
VGVFGEGEDLDRRSVVSLEIHKGEGTLTVPREINCTRRSFFSASSCRAAGTAPGAVTQISKYSSASAHFLSTARTTPPR